MYGSFPYGSRPFGSSHAPAGNILYLASREWLLDGQWYEGDLQLDGLEPQTTFPDEFGILEQPDLSATLVGDYKYLLDQDLDGTRVDLTLIATIDRGGGQTLTQTYQQTLTIQGMSAEAGQVTLDLQGLEATKLDQTYPNKTYEVADYPELFVEHVGRLIPRVVGLGIKVPGTLIKTGAGSGPWRFALCEQGPAAVEATGSQDGVLTVYRSNRIVDPSEYTVQDDTSGTHDVLTVEFDKEPIDFSGNYFEIAADIRDTTSVSRNVATEIRRLLGEAGVSVDSSSIAAAEAVAVTEDMWVDYAYIGARTYKAHLEDLLFLARGGLTRNETGAYELYQDTTSTSIADYDEDAGDVIAANTYQRPPRPRAVQLSYKPNISDPSELSHTIERAVTGGTLAKEKPRQLPQVRDHTAAGKLCNYLANRAAFNRTLSLETYRDQLRPAQVVTITNENLWTGAKDWQVRSATLVPAGSTCELMEYDVSVYTTVAGTPPTDATVGYEPDFSQTPPDAPTGLGFTGADTFYTADGTVLAKVTLIADAPAVNYEYLEFELWESGSSFADHRQRAVLDAVNNDWRATITNLKPNVTYTFKAYAVNPSNVGDNKYGAVATLSVPMAQAAAPDAPTGLTATSIPGGVKVEWVNPTDDDMDEIEVWRDTDIGFGSPTKIAEEKGTQFHDRAGTYGTTYFYRVKAVNRSNLASAYSNQDSAVFSNVAAADVDQTPPASLDPALSGIGGDQVYEDAQGNSFVRVNMDVGTIAADPLRAYVQYAYRKNASASSWKLLDQIEISSGNGPNLTVDDLLPNISYDFAIWAVSHFGISGPESILTHTTAKDSTAPAAPTSCTATQMVGDSIRLEWPDVGANDLRDYRIERNVNGAGYSVYGFANGTVFIDRNPYGDSITYAVRARDTSGNFSGAVFSNTVNVAANISDGDVGTPFSTPSFGDDQVTSDKRQNVNSVSTGNEVAPAGETNTQSMAINESNVPTAMGGGVNTTADFISSIYFVSLSAIIAWAYAGTSGGGLAGGVTNITSKYW